MGPEDVLEHAARAAAREGLHWEARVEHATRRTFALQNGSLVDAAHATTAGLGVRIVAEGCAGYRFTNDLRPASIATTVAWAARVARAHARVAGRSEDPAPVTTGKMAWRNAARLRPEGEPLDARLARMRRAHQAATDRLGSQAGSVVVRWGEWEAERHVRTSDGFTGRAEPLLTALEVMVTLRTPQGMAADKHGFSGAAGLEAYTGERAPEELGKGAAERALDAARARKAPAGRTRALVDPGLAGVLAHESFGHLTEGDVARSGYSLLKGRVGERLGSEHATVVDAPLSTVPGTGIEVPFDDEGTQGRAVRVLERGVFRGYLHDRATAAAEGAAPTGNARALDIRHPPLCRMRNTSFEAGDLSLEEAFEALGDGVYACQSLGGMPRSDGTFLFHALRGWRVEGGELKEPLKAMSLSGNILDFLRQVEGGTRDVQMESFFFGGCGKFDQNGLPVGFGGPHLVIADVFVGGEAG